MPCEISKIITNNSTKPVLVDFQNGKFQPGEENNLESCLYKNNENQTIVGVASKKLVYCGSVENDDLYKNYVVVHNKHKNKAKLIQVDFATLYPLLNNRGELLNKSFETHEKSLADLNKQFGSKRTKRKTEQMERLKMNVDNVKEQLEQTVAGVEIDPNDLGSRRINENESEYRPKINRDATTVEEVYDLEDLVPRDILSTLQEEAQCLVEADLNEFEMKPFIKTAFNALQNDDSVSMSTKLEKFEIVLYVHYLVKFISTPMKNISRSFEVCGSSSDVNQHILENFSVFSGKSRTRPLAMKDKSLCFVLVLLALALDYNVNVEELSKEMRFSIKKILDVARVLGFSAGKTKNSVVLKLPLAAPVTMIAKKKRK